MKQYKFRINGNEYEVAINSVSGNIADVTVNGTQYKVEMDGTAPAAAPSAPSAPSMPQPEPAVTASGAAVSPAQAGKGKPVTSPLPGVIIAVKVNVGETVKSGQTLAILEAMKMENEILAEQDGIVASVNVSKGDSILEGETIVTIQ